jgi:hypothetical protein
MSALGYSVIVFTTFLGGTAGLFAGCCTCFLVVGGDAYGGWFRVSDTVFFLFLLVPVLGGGELGRRLGIRLMAVPGDSANRCPSCGVDRTVTRGQFCEECRRHAGGAGAGGDR